MGVVRRRDSADRKNCVYMNAQKQMAASQSVNWEKFHLSIEEKRPIEFLIRNTGSYLPPHHITLQREAPVLDNVPWRNEKTWIKRIFCPSWKRELMKFIFWCSAWSFMNVKTIKKNYKDANKQMASSANSEMDKKYLFVVTSPLCICLT